MRTFEGGRVDDFKIDGSFPGSDANDQHVRAAAVACQADFVLTCDGGFFVADQDRDAMPYEDSAGESWCSCGDLDG